VSRNAVLIGHGLVGWAICGTTIAVGRQVLSMPTTLLVHAIVAPTIFALLSAHFFHRHLDAAPLGTSLSFVGTVVALDAFVVAPLIERSYAMFTSPLGTWIPFASIWLSSFLVSHTSQQKARRAPVIASSLCIRGADGETAARDGSCHPRVTRHRLRCPGETTFEVGGSAIEVRRMLERLPPQV